MSRSIPVFEPQGELTPQLLSDFLGLVGVQVPPQVAEMWTPNERALAYDYGYREHMRASDNHSVRARPRPWFIMVAETAWAEAGREKARQDEHEALRAIVLAALRAHDGPASLEEAVSAAWQLQDGAARPRSPANEIRMMLSVLAVDGLIKRIRSLQGITWSLPQEARLPEGQPQS